MDQLKKTLDHVSPAVDDIDVGDNMDSRDEEEGHCPDAYLMRRPFKVRLGGGVVGHKLRHPWMFNVELRKPPRNFCMDQYQATQSHSDPFH